jgi:hypothetical protein
VPAVSDAARAAFGTACQNAHRSGVYAFCAAPRTSLIQAGAWTRILCRPIIERTFQGDNLKIAAQLAMDTLARNHHGFAPPSWCRSRLTIERSWFILIQLKKGWPLRLAAPVAEYGWQRSAFTQPMRMLPSQSKVPVSGLRTKHFALAAL